MADIDYYKILGVPKSATTSQIKARYQVLAKKFHPDHSGDDSIMSLINEAYAILSDPQKRHKYDHQNDPPKTSSSSTSSQQRPPYQSYSHSSTQAKTNYQPPRPKQSYQQTQKDRAVQARIKQLEWWINYPYLLPGIFGLFVIAASWSSPYVNRTHWVVWTVVLVAVFSYLYQQLLKASLRKVKERANSAGTANKNANRNGATGIVITIIIFVVIAIIASHHPSSTNSGSTSDVTPAQAAINSMNQYYSPANAADFTAADETSVASSCMTEPAVSGYPYASQVRYCGCALGEVEQNYTPAEVSAAETDGTFSTLNTQSQNAISEYCNSYL